MSQSQSNARVPFKLNLALLTCLLLALAVRLWSIDFGLPHRYHIDEPAYVLAALQIGQGNFHIAYPPPSPSLRQVLLLGLFGLLFLGYLLTGRVNSPAAFARQYQIDPSPFYLLARGLNVVASLATIALLYRLARRRRDERTSLIACLFLSLCFLDARHAHFVEQYSLIALLVVATTYLALSYVRTGGSRHLLLAGLTCGAAIGQRYSMLPLGVTLLLGVLFRWRGDGRKSSLVHTLGLLAAAVMIGYVIGAPAIVLNSRNFLKTFSGQTLLAVTSAGFWGFEFTDMPSWQFYTTIVEIAFGLPLALMVLLGLGLAIRRHSQEDILLLSFPITYGAVLLVVSAASSAFARYLVPVLPFLTFFAADGTVALVGWLTRRRFPRIGNAALPLFVLVLVLIPACRIVRLNLLWAQTDTRTLAKAWIEAKVPAGSRIAGQWHGPPLSTEADPEPNSERIYEVETLNPFSADPKWYSMDYYRDSGFDYLILSSFIYKLRRVDPVENVTRDAFYASLEQQTELVAEFRPYTGQDEPSFFFEQIWGPITDLARFERPGPVIKIYRVR